MLTISDKMNAFGKEFHSNISHIKMANCLRLPPLTLQNIVLSKEKITDAVFKCGHRPIKERTRR
jgi:hypothetical protein